MSGQFSASPSFDELPERISTTPAPATRSARPPAASLGISDTGTDRAALEAAPPTPASRRRRAELGRQVGILLHLACIAFVGTAIIGSTMLRAALRNSIALARVRERRKKLSRTEADRGRMEHGKHRSHP